MELSTRNQLSGTVKAVKEDQIMAEVIVTLGDGQEVVSVITAASVRRLKLAPAKTVKVLIKATEAMLAVEN